MIRISLKPGENVRIRIERHVGRVRIVSHRRGTVYDVSGDSTAEPVYVDLPTASGDNRFDVVCSRLDAGFDVRWELQKTTSGGAAEGPTTVAQYSFPKKPDNEEDNEVIFVQVAPR